MAEKAEKVTTMKLAKSTKHTHVYVEATGGTAGPSGAPEAFPTVYVQQHVFGDSPPPQSLEIVLRWEAK